MAKMIKKNTKMRIASLSRGMADISAETMILSPSIPLMVRRGLSTLKDLRTESFIPPRFIYSRYPDMHNDKIEDIPRVSQV